MITLDIRFIRGIYVNPNPTGHMEWPPSPWRVVHSLWAIWDTRRPEIPRATMETLLSRLLPPPSYRLPVVVPGPEEGVLRIDPDAKLQIHWPRSFLSEGQLEILNDLLLNLPYLGHPENICLARAHTAAPPSLDGFPAADLPWQMDTGPYREVVLLCPAPNFLDAINEVSSEGWTPGARPVTYAFPGGWLGEKPKTIRHHPTPVTLIRYRLQGAHLPVTLTLRLGEGTRRAAMSWFGRLNGRALSETLSGRNKDGNPDPIHHRHAHYLPADEDGDGILDHLSIWAPGGFSREELAALSLLRHVKVEENQPIWVETIFFAALDSPFAAGHPHLFGPSLMWESMTPFIPGRYAKIRGSGDQRKMVETAEDQIHRELSLRGFPAPLAIERYGPENGPSWTTFVWMRKTGRKPAGPPGGWRITFPVPVTGPMALGYGCHFGLGQFRPRP